MVKEIKTESMHNTAKAFGLTSCYDVFTMTESSINEDRNKNDGTLLLALYKKDHNTTLVFINDNYSPVAKIILEKLCNAYGIVFNLIIAGNNQVYGIDLGVELTDKEKRRLQKELKSIWEIHGICKIPTFTLNRMQRLSKVNERAKKGKLNVSEYEPIRKETISNIREEEGLKNHIGGDLNFEEKTVKYKIANIYAKSDSNKVGITFSDLLTTKQTEDIIDKVKNRINVDKVIKRQLVKNEYNDICVYCLIFELEYSDLAERRKRRTIIRKIINNAAREVIL